MSFSADSRVLAVQQQKMETRLRVPAAIAALAGVFGLAACQTGSLQYPDQLGMAEPAPPSPSAAEPLPEPPSPPPVALPPPQAEAAPPPAPTIVPYADPSARAMNEEEAALKAQSSVAVMREGSNVVVEIDGDMLFEPNTAMLTQRGRDVIVSLSGVFKQYPGTYINIDGFIAMGPRALSQDRADEVALLLEQSGVQSQRLSALGHTNDSEGPAPRVEITLEPAAG
jgi:flagellar motor protein MotB